MPVEPSSSQLETAGVLFMDVMGYSKLPVSEQSDVLGTLNQIVRATDSFREVEAAGKLTRLPTGGGMALVFFHQTRGAGGVRAGNQPGAAHPSGDRVAATRDISFSRNASPRICPSPVDGSRTCGISVPWP